MTDPTKENTMSVYDDMAHDAGYTGDEAAQAARMLEEQHLEEQRRSEVERMLEDDAAELAKPREQIVAEHAERARRVDPVLDAMVAAGVIKGPDERPTPQEVVARLVVWLRTEDACPEADATVADAIELRFVPDDVMRFIDPGLWACAIGESDHDPRCPGDCGPCGGAGGVPDTGPNGEMAVLCLTCGGSGECPGCSVGYRLKIAERDLKHARDRAAALDRLVTLHDGLSTAWVCDRCGQPVGKDGTCNSGLHVGPGEDANDRAVATTDVAAELRDTRSRVARLLAELDDAVAAESHFIHIDDVRRVLAG